jgi:hypothetical protein
MRGNIARINVFPVRMSKICCTLRIVCCTFSHARAINSILRGSCFLSTWDMAAIKFSWLCGHPSKLCSRKYQPNHHPCACWVVWPWILESYMDRPRVHPAQEDTADDRKGCSWGAVSFRLYATKKISASKDVVWAESTIGSGRTDNPSLIVVLH